MFSMASVAEEDQLDRDAARKVLRRAWDTLGPYRRQLRLAVALIVLYTLTILAGPYLREGRHRPGHQAGRRARPSTSAWPPTSSSPSSASW